MGDVYFPPPPIDPKSPWFPILVLGDFRNPILYVSNFDWYYPWPPGLAAAGGFGVATPTVALATSPVVVGSGGFAYAGTGGNYNDTARLGGGGLGVTYNYIP
jgi:hypothetical protein